MEEDYEYANKFHKQGRTNLRKTPKLTVSHLVEWVQLNITPSVHKQFYDIKQDIRGCDIKWDTLHYTVEPLITDPPHSRPPPYNGLDPVDVPTAIPIDTIHL